MADLEAPDFERTLLSPSEWQVLRALRKGCASAAEIARAMPPPPLTESTVQALLGRLAQRGILYQEGPRPSVLSETYEALLRQQIEKFIDDYVADDPAGVQLLHTVFRERLRSHRPTDLR